MAQARIWTVEADPATGAVDPEELQAALYECGVFLLRAGGSTSQLAYREPVDPENLPGVFFTWRVVIQWSARTDTPPRAEESNTRKQDVLTEVPDVEVEPAPEPVAA